MKQGRQLSLFTQEGSGELFRMEKSVMTKSNFDELGMLSADAIPEALLEFICYEHQYNIFGYGLLDPAEFAKQFHFSFHYLVGKHETPYQLQLRKLLKNEAPQQNRRSRQIREQLSQDEVMCLNRIENALFILANYSLNVTSTSVQEDQTLIRQHGYLRVLEQFSVIQDGRTGKIRYAYKLDDKFRRNLTSMYLTTRRDSLVALRKSRLGPMYVFLLKLREALFAEGRDRTFADNTPEFEYLCKIAGVAEYEEAKYRKRDLNKALKKINEVTELDFRVEWVKGYGNERYTPLFYFIPQNGKTVDAPGSLAMRVARNSERTDIAVHEFIHNLVELCPFRGNRFDDDAEAFFSKWLLSERPEDIRVFSFALESTFVNIGCGIPADIADRVKLFVRLSRSHGDTPLHEWMRSIFNGSQGFSLPPFRSPSSL